MSDPWQQDLDTFDDEDGFVDGMDDEDEELGMDLHTGVGMDPMHAGRGEPVLALEDMPNEPRRARRAHNPPAASPARRARIRPMSQAMARRFPQVQSMLLTMSDGRQVLFVRQPQPKGRR